MIYLQYRNLEELFTQPTHGVEYGLLTNVQGRNTIRFEGLFECDENC